MTRDYRAAAVALPATHARDLSAAVRFYLGCEHKSAHSAVADAEAALSILDAQVGRYALPADPKALYALIYEIDVGGRFRRGAGGEVEHLWQACRSSAGRHAITDPNYLIWVLKTLPLLPDARALIDSALAARIRRGDLSPLMLELSYEGVN